MTFYQLDTDISDATQWELLYSNTYQADPTPSIYAEFYALDHLPIPPQQIPILFETHILIVKATITPNKENWKLAGNIKQFIRTGVSGSNQYDSMSINRRIWLRENNLMIFPIVGDDYRLTYEIPYWIPRISLTIHGYNLEVESEEVKRLKEASNQLVLMNATLESINNRI